MITISGTLRLETSESGHIRYINVVRSHHILHEGDLLHSLGHHSLHLLHISCSMWLLLNLCIIVTKLVIFALSLNHLLLFLLFE